tara:strand:+ start:87 stop:377 length:291 start_codon:yes stop_codon:yes gene_type:complete
MNHKKYLQSLLHLIDDKGYTVECECEGEEISKNEALNEVDETFINVMNEDGDSEGWIHFTFYNDWDESISDYTLGLEDILGLNKFIDSHVKSEGVR